LGTYGLTLEHQPIATRSAAVLWWRGSSALQILGITFIGVALLDVQDPDLPFPEIRRVTDIKKFLLATQLKIAQPLATGVPSVISTSSGIENTRATIGLTSFKTARKMSRLKGEECVCFMPADYT
jgi:hypothetical protein